MVWSGDVEAQEKLLVNGKPVSFVKGKGFLWWSCGSEIQQYISPTTDIALVPLLGERAAEPVRTLKEKG